MANQQQPRAMIVILCHLLLLSSINGLYTELISDNGNFIAVYSDALITRATALSYCENELGSTLASIHSAMEDSEAFNAAKSIANSQSSDGNFDGSYLIWIGLNDLTTNNVFEWSDGTDVDYTNWAQNPSLDNNTEPNGDGSKECVHMYGNEAFNNPLGKWNDHSCGLSSNFQGGSKTFICNNPMYDVLESENGKYIAVFTNDLKLTWDDALYYCENVIGTTLASIHSDEENKEAFDVAKALANEKSLDDGFDNSFMIWIGFTDLIEDETYMWSDGTTFDYDNWSQNPTLGITEPNGDGQLLCGHMYGAVIEDFGNGLGEWNDHVCDDLNFVGGAKTFICNGLKTIEPSEEPTQEPLPDNF